MVRSVADQEALYINPTNEHLFFHVRACDHVRIMFAQSFLYGNDLELQISNDFTHLVNVSSQEVLAEEQTPGILGCLAQHEFWLSWNGGIFRVTKSCIDCQYQDLGIFCISVRTRSCVHARNLLTQPRFRVDVVRRRFHENTVRERRRMAPGLVQWLVSKIQ